MTRGAPDGVKTMAASLLVPDTPPVLLATSRPIGQPGGDLLAPLLPAHDLDHQPAGGRGGAAVLDDHRQQLGHVARRALVVERLVEGEGVLVVELLVAAPAAVAEALEARRR